MYISKNINLFRDNCSSIIYLKIYKGILECFME